MKQPRIPPPLNDLLFKHRANLPDILHGNRGAREFIQRRQPR